MRSDQGVRFTAAKNNEQLWRTFMESFIGCQKADLPALDYMGTSTFSQYTVLHQESVAKIRKDAPLEKV